MGKEIFLCRLGRGKKIYWLHYREWYASCQVRGKIIAAVGCENSRIIGNKCIFFLKEMMRRLGGGCTKIY